MAKQTINIGSTANDGTGDPLRTAFNKANENFTEVYDIAQGAYDYANTIVSDTQVDPLARSIANSAFDAANTANVLAQAAFDNSNTKVTFSNTFTLEANDSVTIAYTDGSTSESVFYAEQGLASITVIDSGTPGAKLQLNSSNVVIDNGQGSNPIDLTVSGNVIANALKIEQGVQESYSNLTSATGVVTHNCANGQIFYHTSPSDNFTANFTNLTLASGRATSLTLVINQGGTGYIANNIQIGGSAQTINWSGNTEPTANTNSVDVMSFSVLNNSGTFVVLGQLSTFG